MPLVSPEEVCSKYAIAVAEVRRLGYLIGNNQCGRLVEGDYGVKSCIARYWYCGYAYEDICPHCQIALSAIKDRRLWRAKLGAAKRSIEIVGKRLNAVKPCR